MTLPTWLDNPTTSDTQFRTSGNPLGQYPATRAELDYRELQYENFFEAALDRIMEGATLSTLVKNDPRGIDYGKFQSWIRKDKERKKRYYEAKEIGSERVEDELIDISDAADNPMEDVARSTLRINTRKWLLGVWDKRRYGDDRNAPTGGGGGPITINIGQVESPYQQAALVEDVTPAHPLVSISDVEDKNVNS